MTEATAVVLQEPECLTLSSVELTPPSVDDVVVEVDFSGISTGTERLLWSGRMPPFPGMGYPLVPGYESVGRVVQGNEHVENGTTVFVPGSNGFVDVRGLFGGAASTLVVPSARVIPIASDLGEQGVLLALAATAQHALGDSIPDLIVGHGVLGRLLARLAVARGGAPT
ncbi:MAG: chlorophyll synthesis pathway protein BchC, partial [Myxococcota bacterium]